GFYPRLARVERDCENLPMFSACPRWLLKEASLRARPRLKMGQRQRRAGLQRLDRDVASHLADDGKFEQLGDEKLPIVLEIGNDHFQEVIDLAGDEVKTHDFRHRKHRLLESQSLIVGMGFDLDAYEDRKAQTNALSLQHGPI